MVPFVFATSYASCHYACQFKNRPIEPVREMVGEEGLEPSRFFRPADFKSTAYTNSATRPHGNPANFNLRGFVEARTGVEPVYKVLQTSA